MELKLADNPTIEIVSEKAFLDALEKTNADALETLSEKQEEYKRIWSTARSVGRDFHGLTDGQKKAFDLVKEGKNVYLTGLAGTGKSYIVERIIEWAQTSGLNVITCAPTGIAALNVGGSTVHRVLCIRPGRTLEKDPHPFVPTDSPLPDCDLLILDEVSMCRMDLFDYLSAVLKIAGKIRKQKGKGLCQLLVVGDFCQLPPVITNEERRFLEEKYGYDVGEAFAFQSSEWAFWNFEEVRAAYMRVFDFDGTIYDGESLFDLYLFSAKYNPKVLRYIAPVLRYAIKYKLGRATFDQMEYGVGKLCHGYLSELAESLEFEELVNAFWDQNMKRIKPWYEPREDDVILTASFDITVGEACRRLGVQHLVSSTIDGNTLNVNYLNFNTNKPKRFRELYGDNVRVDEFYTDSRFDQPMIDMARRAYMVKGNKIHQVK